MEDQLPFLFVILGLAGIAVALLPYGHRTGAGGAIAALVCFLVAFILALVGAN